MNLSVNFLKTPGRNARNGFRRKAVKMLAAANL
jgi:hypothetical protein